MKKNIAVLPGDGIGPEIIQEAVKVLDAVAKVYDHDFHYTYASGRKRKCVDKCFG